MRYFFCFIFFFLLYLPAFSQHFSISGTVQNGNDGDTFPGATVLLAHPTDSSTIKGTVTDLEGKFELTDIEQGKYLLMIQYIGFAPLSRAIVLDQDLNMGILPLEEAGTWLGEITVSGRRAMEIQQGDTVQYNAAAFKTLQDASAQSLVEKMPGISLQDGALQAQGENVVQVLIDGKPFFGRDVKAALQNLPAEVIESVQIFDKKSDKAEFSGFDDGEREKTINIITKPNRRKGQFGKSSLGYGNAERYLAGTSINLFNEDRRATVTALSNNINALDYSADPNSQGDSRIQDGIITTNTIGLSFSDDWGKKIEISGSYLYSQRENEGNASRVRNYVLDFDPGRVYRQNSNNTRTNKDHTFDLRFDYKIDDYNKLLIRPNVSLKHDEGNSYFFGRTLSGDAPLNQTENSLLSSNYDYDFGNRLYYSHRFLKKGRNFSLGLNTGYHSNEDEGSRLADNYYYDEQEKQETLNQLTTLDRKGLSWDATISFTEPLGKKGQVELEYQIRNNLNDSDKLTYDAMDAPTGDTINMILLLDTTLSNTFNSQYLSQEVELGYQYRAKKLRMQLELSIQQAGLKNDQEFPMPFSITRNFQTVSPTVRLDYEFS